MKAWFSFIFSLSMILFLSACRSPSALNSSGSVSNAPVGAEAGNGQPATSQPVSLNVFAAASLSEAFQELGEFYTAQNPNVTLAFNFAGSQQLSQQIDAGAPVDVFASANQKQMEAVITAGHVLTGSQQTFVKNRLVVIFPLDNPAEIIELQDLARAGQKLVLAAKEVPAGQYSLEFLDKAGQEAELGPAFRDQVLKNVVSYEENVKVVLRKVALGEADAGIVYTSDIAGASAGKVGQLAIADHLNIIASYPIAVVQESKNIEQAGDFITLILSAEGQSILAKYGFIPVNE